MIVKLNWREVLVHLEKLQGAGVTLQNHKETAIIVLCKYTPPIERPFNGADMGQPNAPHDETGVIDLLPLGDGTRIDFRPIELNDLPSFVAIARTHSGQSITPHAEQVAMFQAFQERVQKHFAELPLLEVDAPHLVEGQLPEITMAEFIKLELAAQNGDQQAQANLDEWARELHKMKTIPFLPNGQPDYTNATSSPKFKDYAEFLDYEKKRRDKLKENNAEAHFIRQSLEFVSLPPIKTPTTPNRIVKPKRGKRGANEGTLGRCKKALEQWLETDKSFTAAAKYADISHHTVKRNTKQVLSELQALDPDRYNRWVNLIKAKGREDLLL